MSNLMSCTRHGQRWRRRMRGFRVGLHVRILGFLSLSRRCLASVSSCWNWSKLQGRRRRKGRRRRTDEISWTQQSNCNLYSLRSCGRSNSFCAEAIADCLEFIRRSSVPQPCQANVISCCSSSSSSSSNTVR
ncbi:hypothetical protein IHE45_05G238400 [Dioscorea alata]|uniref:Uncharacterized protein n=1 Tax=Dioscorea alata TaxID=55571 RepID=A0ACB7W9V8_DIOAL|nr:hypothetical protein IHE45_05G238400 [Dioscorea alata]